VEGVVLFFAAILNIKNKANPRAGVVHPAGVQYEVTVDRRVTASSLYDGGNQNGKSNGEHSDRPVL